MIAVYPKQSCQVLATRSECFMAMIGLRLSRSEKESITCSRASGCGRERLTAEISNNRAAAELLSSVLAVFFATRLLYKNQINNYYHQRCQLFKWGGTTRAKCKTISKLHPFCLIHHFSDVSRWQRESTPARSSVVESLLRVFSRGYVCRSFWVWKMVERYGCGSPTSVT